MGEKNGNVDFLSFLEPAFQNSPDKEAFVTIDGQRVTYDRFRQIIVSFAAHAHQHGLAAGDCVVIDVQNDVATLCLLISLSSLGVTTSLNRNIRQVSDAGCNIDAVVTTQARFDPTPRKIGFTQDWFTASADEIAATPRVGFRSDSGYCVISSSAGTTGTPKILGFTFEIMVNRVLSYDGYLSNDAPKRLTTFSPGVNIGFLSYLSTLYNGGTIYRPKDSPEATLELIDKERVDELFTTPNLLADLVSARKALGNPKKTLSRVTVAGGRISLALLTETQSTLSNQVYIGYGSAEAGGTATCVFDEDRHIEGLVGHPYNDAVVACVGDDGRELPPQEIGVVRISAPGRIAVSSYLGDDPSGGGIFRDGWFFPGDLGFLTEEGALVITGRTEGVINLGGNKISSEKLEDVCARYDHVSKSCVFGVESADGFDDIGIAVICSPGFDLDDFERFLRDRTGLKERIHIEVLDAFPVNASDKVDRIKVKVLFDQKQRV